MSKVMVKTFLEKCQVMYQIKLLMKKEAKYYLLEDLNYLFLVYVI